MAAPTTDAQVYESGGRLFIDVPEGRGEELRLHLEAHNIRALGSRLTVPGFDRLELEPDADPVAVHAILDHWER